MALSPVRVFEPTRGVRSVTVTDAVTFRSHWPHRTAVQVCADGWTRQERSDFGH
jgi:hypothetical protein